MAQINFIFVNETGSENAVRDIRLSPVPDFRQHIVVNGACLSRDELIRRLVRLRCVYPHALILGLQEIKGRFISASDCMNRIRRELSDIP